MCAFFGTPCRGPGSGGAVDGSSYIDDTDYNLDSLSTSAGTAQWLMSIGAAQVCPLNTCSGFNSAGQYMVYQTSNNQFCDASDPDCGQQPDNPDQSCDESAGNGGGGDGSDGGDSAESSFRSLTGHGRSSLAHPFADGPSSSTSNSGGANSCTAKNKGGSTFYPYGHDIFIMPQIFTAPTCKQLGAWAVDDGVVATIASGGGKWWNPVSGAFAIAASLEGGVWYHYCQQ